MPKTTTKKKMVMVVVVSWRGLHKYRRFCCFWYYIYGDHLPPVNEQVDFYDWKNRWSDGGTESDVDEHSICSSSPFEFSPKFKFKERLSSLPNGYCTVLLFVSAKLNSSPIVRIRQLTTSFLVFNYVYVIVCFGSRRPEVGFPSSDNNRLKTSISRIYQ